MKVLNKLLFWSLCGNYWLWFHMLAGAILGKVGILFFSKTLTISLIAILAMIWEIVEYYLECGGDIKRYNSSMVQKKDGYMIVLEMF